VLLSWFGFRASHPGESFAQPLGWIPLRYEPPLWTCSVLTLWYLPHDCFSSPGSNPYQKRKSSRLNWNQKWRCPKRDVVW
jgi:hypothetical protein